MAPSFFGAACRKFSDFPIGLWRRFMGRLGAISWAGRSMLAVLGVRSGGRGFESRPG